MPSARPETRTSTRPRSVNLTALPARLISTWRTRTGSPRTQAGQSGGERKFQADVLLPDRGLEDSKGLLHGIAQIEVDRLDVHLAGFDPGQIEDVVQYAQQRLGRVQRHLQVLSLLRVRTSVQGQIEHAHDAVHGSADLVTHVGEKLTLDPAGIQGAIARNPQFIGEW